MKRQRNYRAMSGWTLLCAATIVGGMLWADAAAQAAIPRVEAVVLAACTVEETAVVSGQVAAAQGTEVTVEVPCVAGEIAVQVGDRVEKGDVLMEVDRAGTLAMAVSVGLSQENATAVSATLPQTVTAPHSGVVSAVCAAEGDTLSSGTACVVLSENGEVEIAVQLRESVLPRIAVGQEVTVSGVAFRKAAYRGTVSSVASSARSRLVGTSGETVVDAVVTLLPEEADESLLIGLNAKVTVMVEKRENVLLVPYDCLTACRNGKATVYCVQGNTAYRREVTLGKDYPEGAEVSGGLQAGEAVVRTPERLTGDTVQVCAEETA